MAPTAPPGLASVPADNSEEQLQKEITSTIEQQVRHLLLQARNETESKVKVELKGIIEKMMVMERTLDQLNQQLDAVDTAKDGGAANGGISPETVSKLLSNVEQQWGQEIKTLKEELHQTILAHNHNADLIKHHKETLDNLQERSQKMAGSNLKPADVQAQLAKLDKAVKMQQQKQPQNKVESLVQRLGALEAYVGNINIGRLTMAQQWRGYGMGAGAPGMPPGMLAGLGGLPGLNGADAAASLLP